MKALGRFSWRCWCVIAVCVIAVAGGYIVLVAAEPSSPAFTAGLEAFGERDIPGAILNLEEALRRTEAPAERAEINLLLGLAYRWNDQPDKAIAALEAVMAFDPHLTVSFPDQKLHDLNPTGMLGLCYRDKGDWATALKWWERCLEEWPDSDRMTVNIGTARQKLAESSQPNVEYSLESYTLTRTPAPEVLVRGVDVNALATKHLPTLEAYQERIIGPWGTRVTLRDSARESKAEIRIAVYDSVVEAENQALSYLNSISTVCQKADPAELKIGDSSNCWVSDRQAGSSVTFVRTNVLVAVSVYAANAPEEVRRIARAIDEDILTGTEAVKLGQKVPTNSVSLVDAGPFRDSVDSWLQKEIERRIAEIREQTPLSDQDKEHLWSCIREVNLKNSADNDAIRALFRENRRAALPLLEAALRNENAEVRQKARLCLRREPKEYQTEDYKKTEEVMVLLLLRSADDKEAAVRRGATATLGAIAFADHRNPPSNPALHMNQDLWDRLVDTLQQMLSDSDESVSYLGALALYRIGEGPNPTDEEY